LPVPTRIFSLRNKSDFLAYLDQLEREIPDEHLKIAREIYGDV